MPARLEKLYQLPLVQYRTQLRRSGVTSVTYENGGAGLAAGPMAIADAAGLDADLLAGTGWESFLVVNVAQAEGSQTPFPRAARLDWDQAARTA